MKFEVYGHATVLCSMVVEADTEAEAIKIANDEYGDLTNYVGNGGTDKLIGTVSSEDERTIYPDAEPVFDDCKLLAPWEEKEA